MSIDPFPEHVSPRKWCDRNGTINSSIPLGKLLRLSEYLDNNHGQAEVCISFDRDAGGHCCLTGSVNATVNLQCQRCLRPVAVALASKLDIKLAANDVEAGRIADSAADPLERLEIVVCDQGELDLLAVIEDELIMSLPIVASHEDAACNDAFNALHAGGRQEDGRARANIKGLDVLEKLKQELQQNRQDGNSRLKQDKESNNN